MNTVRAARKASPGKPSLYRRLRTLIERSRTPIFYQAQTTECGVAALAIMLGHFGRWVTLEEVREKTGVSRDGTNASDLLRAAKEYGLYGKAFRVELEALHRRKMPLIAHLRFIHFVVIEKVAKTYVYVNDPHAGRHRMRVEEFAESFTGVAIEFEPGEEFQRGGRRWRLRDWMLAQFDGLRPQLLQCAALGAAMALAGSVFAFLFARLFAQTGAAARNHENWSLAALAAAGLLRLALGYGLEACLLRIERALSARTPEFLRRMVALPWSFFSYRLPDDLLDIVLSHDEMARALARQCLRALAAATSIPVLLAALLLADPVAGAGAIGIAGICALCCAFLLRRSGRFRNVSASFLDAWGASWADTIRRIEMHRSGGRDQDFFSGFAAGFANTQGARQLSERSSGGMRTVCRAAQLLLAAGMVAGAHRFALPALMAILLLGIQLLAALYEAIAVQTAFLGLGRQARQADQVACLNPAERPVEFPGGIAHVRGAVRVERLCFGFSRFRLPLLKEISFTVAPGEQVGISGATGSGKSTLAAVMTGLHRPWSGSVALDGIPLEAIPPRSLTRLIGWVHKTPLLFEATLRENISLWDPAVSAADVASAVQDACLDDVLGTRSGGLEMRVTSQGANFSGGQRQRIEIARALARNVRVLILDEANDALESDLEERIRANLRRRGCTLILISHRETTLRACDRVLYMEAGRIQASPAEHENPSAGVASAPPPMPVHGADAPCSAELAAAFRTVARASNIRLDGALPGVPAQGEAGVLELARRWGLRARRVKLIRRRWWRWRDYGPMLAFLDQAPIALLPGLHGYCVANGKTKVLLQDAEAARLGKHMYVLYVPDESSRSGAELMRRAAGAHKGEMVRVAVWACAAAVAASLLPLLVFRALVGGTQRTGSIMAALAACAAFVLFDTAFHAAFLRAAARVQTGLAASLFERLLRLPAEYFRRHSAGMLGARLAGASLALDGGVGGPLASLFALPLCLAGLVLTVTLTPRAALFALAISALLVLTPVLAVRKELALEPKRAALHAAQWQFLSAALQGFARLRVLSSESRVVAQWRKLWSAERALTFQQLGARSLSRAMESATLAALALFAFGVAHSSSSLPRLAAGTLAFLQCVFGAAMVGQGLGAVYKIRSLLRPLDGFLAEHYESQMPGLRPRAASGALELRHVAFQYGDARGRALEDVSLAVTPGEMLAITGPSGSGKSTLLRILAGLEKPQKGDLLYDGFRLQDWDANALRAQFSVVLQEDSLTVSTARYNIAGMGEYRLEEVWEAARLAAVDADLEGMPMGIQTILEDERVSTGQRQRILLASRLLRRPRVLFLDEAASALDAKVQQRVLGNIRALGSTCICVTHRASTVALADRVAVLDGGRLAWIGPVGDWLALQPSPLVLPVRGCATSHEAAPSPAGLHRHAAERRVFRAYALEEFHAPFGVGSPAFLIAPRHELAAAGGALLTWAAVQMFLLL
jgi:ABC-type bacteriocin/lantibiotic exporter with double-glycine peptidase domain